MDEIIEKLNSYLRKVESLGRHSRNNAYELQRMYNQVYIIVSNLPKSHDYVYNSILTGMSESENKYELGIQNPDDYFWGRSNLIDDIKDTIQSYIHDNNLGT